MIALLLVYDVCFHLAFVSLLFYLHFILGQLSCCNSLPCCPAAVIMYMPCECYY